MLTFSSFPISIQGNFPEHDQSMCSLSGEHQTQDIPKHLCKGMEISKRGNLQLHHCRKLISQNSFASIYLIQSHHCMCHINKTQYPTNFQKLLKQILFMFRNPQVYTLPIFLAWLFTHNIINLREQKFDPCYGFGFITYVIDPNEI